MPINPAAETKAPAIDHVGVHDAARMLEPEVEHGLSAKEVARRQRKFGLNRMVTRRGMSGWQRFLKQITEPLICVLIGAAVMTTASACLRQNSCRGDLMMVEAGDRVPADLRLASPVVGSS